MSHIVKIETPFRQYSFEEIEKMVKRANEKPFIPVFKILDYPQRLPFTFTKHEEKNKEI